MWEFLRFAAWTVTLVFACDFVYSAFHQGRHLNKAFKYRPKKRSR
jgi:hypothetical protein